MNGNDALGGWAKVPPEFSEGWNDDNQTETPAVGCNEGLGAGDPLLNVMAELISLPHKIAMRVSVQAMSDRLEGERLARTAKMNAEAAQRQFDFLMSQRA